MKIFVLLLAATGALRTLAAVDPAQLTAARALYDTRGKSAEAQQAFEKIAAADPKSADAQYFLAQLALRRNDAEKAVVYAEKSVALAPDNADCHNVLGDA